MTKRIPERMCSGCMKRKPKNELIRIARTCDGNIKIDRTGKSEGRGVYICKDEKCLATASKKKRFSRSLKADISDEIYNELADFIKN